MANPKSVVSGQWLVLAAAFLGWMFDGLEMGIFPLVARPALQDMMHGAGGGDEFVAIWMGRITALFLVGAACGGLSFGWLGDRLGRVRAMMLSVLTYSLFTGLCYFAQAPWHLGVLRFVAAFGMGGEWSLGVALVMEAWPEEKRPMLAGVIGAAANVGFALIAVVGLFFKVTQNSWRWVMLAGAAPAALALVIQLFVPESERWKASVKQSVARPVQEIAGDCVRFHRVDRDVGIGAMAAAVGGSVDRRRDVGGQGKHANPFRSRRGRGMLVRRRLWRRDQPATGVFWPLPRVAGFVRVPVSRGGPVRGVVSGHGISGRRDHGGILRLVSTLSARAVSDACARDRARRQLQLRPHPGGGRRADAGPTRGAL